MFRGMLLNMLNLVNFKKGPLGLMLRCDVKFCSCSKSLDMTNVFFLKTGWQKLID